jgi:hypothetical protein
MSGAQRAGAALANAVLATGGAMRGVGSAVAAGSVHFTNLNFGVTSVAGAFRNAVGEVLKTTGALAALPATLFALAKSASSTAGEIRNSALAAGVSTTAYQEFAGAAGKLGSEQEQLGQAFAVIASQSGEVQHALVEADKANAKFARYSTARLHFKSVVVDRLARTDLQRNLCRGQDLLLILEQFGIVAIGTPCDSRRFCICFPWPVRNWR